MKGLPGERQNLEINVGCKQGVNENSLMLSLKKLQENQDLIIE